MGLIKGRTVYRADTGKVYELHKMSPSHLINVIGHHMRQLNTLDMIKRQYRGDMTLLKKRYDELDDLIDYLVNELMERDPAKDAEKRAQLIVRVSCPNDYADDNDIYHIGDARNR